jgi:DNA-binding MarR family transcriptional regulator
MNDQQQPFVENYLAFLLAKASHQISGEFHQRLRDMGVSIGTWRILGALSDRDHTVGSLAEIVLMNQPTLSKALDKLEQDALITRERQAHNRRSVSVAITEKGMTLAQQLIGMANQHEAEVFSAMSEQDQTHLRGLLRQLIFTPE